MKHAKTTPSKLESHLMSTLFAISAQLPEGWVNNLRVSIGEDGRIAELTVNTSRQTTDIAVPVLLPAPGNLHSHAFQRAMAGMTERRGTGPDSFWTWRELMYRFLDVLTPQHMRAIATLAYVEMLEAGFASVGEFHYVHHQPGGQPYDDLAELSLSIFAAATEAGIGLTHLPVLYTYGGAGKQPLAGGQLRFGNDPDRFSKLLEQLRPAVKALAPDASLGIAPHSLRATDPEALRRASKLLGTGPVHIHVAEQTAEVEQISEWLSARPVEFLLGEIGIDRRWCLIHATHMTASETAGLAASGAVAGLCPITEANLGDGLFNAPDFLAAGGRFGLGTDSNIRISLTGELRLLEYGQRLLHRSRNVLAPEGASVGETLYRGAARGAARAMARDSGEIRIGAWADLVALDNTSPALMPLADDALLDGWIFASTGQSVTDVWSAGRHCVADGRHFAREKAEAGYRTAMADLMARS